MTHALADEPHGWQASLDLAFARRGGMTVLSENRHTGPLRVQRPLYPEAGVCHAYVLHPPGGVVGGDRLELCAEVHAGASALLTTPGATKFYRSNGETAVQESRLAVAHDGRLEWLPQESIIYPGADAEVATWIDLADGAGFIGWEFLCIGLPACGRGFGQGRLKTSIEVRRESRLLFKDRLQVLGEADLARPAGLRGCTVCATLVAAGCDPRMVAPLREIAGTAAGMMTGITLMEDLLVARCIGHDSAEAKSFFRRLWSCLRPALFGNNACPPRIWET